MSAEAQTASNVATIEHSSVIQDALSDKIVKENGSFFKAIFESGLKVERRNDEYAKSRIFVEYSEEMEKNDFIFIATYTLREYVDDVDTIATVELVTAIDDAFMNLHSAFNALGELGKELALKKLRKRNDMQSNSYTLQCQNSTSTIKYSLSKATIYKGELHFVQPKEMQSDNLLIRINVPAISKDLLKDRKFKPLAINLNNAVIALHQACLQLDKTFG